MFFNLSISDSNPSYPFSIENEVNNLSIVIDSKSKLFPLGLTPAMLKKFNKLKEKFTDEESLIVRLKQMKMKKGGLNLVKNKINKWWNTLNTF